MGREEIEGRERGRQKREGGTASSPGQIAKRRADNGGEGQKAALGPPFAQHAPLAIGDEKSQGGGIGRGQGTGEEGEEAYNHAVRVVLCWGDRACGSDVCCVLVR